jgi:hypothetical protein
MKSMNNNYYMSTNGTSRKHILLSSGNKCPPNHSNDDRVLDVGGSITRDE